MLYPHYDGDVLPVTNWNSTKDSLVVNFDTESSTIVFEQNADGRTEFHLENFGDGVCRTDIVIDEKDIYTNNDIPGTTGVYRVQNTIETNDTIIVAPADGPVSFFAGQSILLNAGFEVELGGEFSAEIEDCNPAQKIEFSKQK